MIPDIRFQCQEGCANCCDQDGFVYLSEKDVTRAAKFVGMKQAAFEKQLNRGTSLRFTQTTQCPPLATKQRGKNVSQDD